VHLNEVVRLLRQVRLLLCKLRHLPLLSLHLLHEPRVVFTGAAGLLVQGRQTQQLLRGVLQAVGQVSAALINRLDEVQHTLQLCGEEVCALHILLQVHDLVQVHFPRLPRTDR